MQIETGEQLSLREAERSVYNPQYKEFSSGLTLLNPIGPLQEWKSMKKLDQQDIQANRKVSPFDFIVSPQAETLMKMSGQLESMKIISEPSNPVLFKAEEVKLRAVTEGLRHRDLKCFDSIIRTMIKLEDEPTMIHDDYTIYVFNPMQKEVHHFLRHEFMEGKPEMVVDRFVAGELPKARPPKLFLGLRFYWKRERASSTRVIDQIQPISGIILYALPPRSEIIYSAYMMAKMPQVNTAICSPRLSKLYISSCSSLTCTQKVPVMIFTTKCHGLRVYRSVSCYMLVGNSG